MPSSSTPWLVVLLAATTLQSTSAQGTCRAKGDCTDSQFCRYPDGACAPPGVCQEIPFVCTMDYRPQCGCDGKTYGNACGAFSAAQSIRFEGECESQVAGGSGGGIPAPPGPPEPAGGPAVTSGKEHHHAKRDLLSIMADESLLRMERDKAPASSAVASAAAANGVGPSAPIGMGGATRQQRCGSRGLGACAEGEFCDFVDGLCGETDTGGYCTQQTLACPKIYRPVCACDGQTYGNACMAKAQGVSVRFEGPCAAVMEEEPSTLEEKTFTLPQPLADVLNGSNGDAKVQNCGGLQGLACPKGQNCIYPRGTCGAADEMGVCMSPPFICALIYQPVCGCGDAGTFSNECYAHSQGVSVSAYGPCPAPGQADAIPPHNPITPPNPTQQPPPTTSKEEEHLRGAGGGGGH